MVPVRHARRGMDMYCTECGNKIQPGERFCTRCGSVIAAVPEEREQGAFALQEPAVPQVDEGSRSGGVPRSDAMPRSAVHGATQPSTSASAVPASSDNAVERTCPVCGAHLTSGFAFCTECGAKVSAAVGSDALRTTPATGSADSSGATPARGQMPPSAPAREGISVPSDASARGQDLSAARQFAARLTNTPAHMRPAPQEDQMGAMPAQVNPTPAQTGRTVPVPASTGEPHVDPRRSARSHAAGAPALQPASPQPQQLRTASAHGTSPHDNPFTTGKTTAPQPVHSHSAPSREDRQDAAQPAVSRPTPSSAAQPVAPQQAQPAVHRTVAPHAAQTAGQQAKQPVQPAQPRNVQPPQSPTWRNSNTPVIIGVAAVILVLVAAAGAFIWTHGSIQGALDAITGNVSDATVYYASDDAVEVAEDTHLVPKSSQGEPLTSYVVRIKQADNADGVAIDPSELPNLSVEGSQGFSLGDFGSLQAGTYLLSVTDSADTEYDLPPLTLDMSGSTHDAPSRLDIAASSSTATLAKRGKYACFRDVLNGLVDAYGDASLTVLMLDEERYLGWVAGVSYAELVDFGDGIERLVVMYCTDSSFTVSDVIEVDDDAPATDAWGPRAENYQIEVWEYDTAADEAIMVCQMAPAENVAGGAYLAYGVNPLDESLCLRAGGTDVNGSAAQLSYGVRDDGTFGTLSVDSSEADRWETAKYFQFLHVGMTQDAALDDAGTGETSCEGTAQTVKDLTAKLATLCGE